MASRPANGADLQVAQRYFRKALKLKTGELTAKVENNLLTAYLAGVRAMEQSSTGQAIAASRPVYNERPQYLGGFLVDQLYQAYLELGQTVEEQERFRFALTQYGKAAALQVDDRSDALRLLRELAVSLTLTPTPTLTPAPFPTWTPVPKTIADYKGWIIFYSNRDGGAGLYVMRPDGSDVQPAPREARSEPEKLRESEQTMVAGRKNPPFCRKTQQFTRNGGEHF